MVVMSLAAAGTESQTAEGETVLHTADDEFDECGNEKLSWPCSSERIFF